MARWICFCFILCIFLFNNITMMMLTDHRIISKKHIGSARDKLFRAKPLPQYNNNIFQRQQQPLPSPDALRSRWTELFNEQYRINQPLLIEG